MQMENQKKTLSAINSDVSGSSFKNVKAEQVTFQCCNLAGVRFNDVNLTGMNISDANLSEIIIDGAQWGGAHFQHLGYADKDQQEQENSVRQPVQFTHCSLKQGLLTDCDLTNVRLENCDITGMVINGVRVDELFKLHVSAGQK